MRNIRKALLATVSVRPFDNKGGWKKDADGKLVLSASGDPIYIDGDGRELVTEAGTISRLNAEAKTHREGKEAAEMKLKAYEGIDPVKARDATEKLSKIDQKLLIDKGEVDAVKKQIEDQFKGQLTELQKANEQLTGDRDGLIRKNAFAASEFIRERLNVPPEMFEATFGGLFKVEDGKLVPYGRDGNKIYSKKRMGEIADVDEAFEIIVEGYAHKDQILKPEGSGGTGSGGGGGNRGAGRRLSRTEFQAMTPADQAAAATSMAKGELTIVDAPAG